MRVALYLRVSTSGQTAENQRRDLMAALRQRKGWRVVETYLDHGVSGAKGRDQRPEFDRLQRDAVRGKFDIVAAWSVDRLGRSVLHLAQLLGELQAAGVGLYLHRQGIDTTTPAGRALFGMAGVFAEFERELIRERTLAGIARARAQGKRIGRPRVEAATERRVRACLAGGQGIRATARACQVGAATVQRIAAGR